MNYFLARVVSAAMIAYCAFRYGMRLEQTRMMEEAVKAGVGEFYLDASHQKKFRFKEVAE